MKSFKVSIILPVYNVEKYLENCLDSLLAQTLDDIEIVAVNDGSTDGSLQVLEAYQQCHPEKLFIYSTENHGVSHARNYGFFKSHGEYVWFVDSDDYVEPDACRQLYEKATADDNDLVLFRYYNVDADTGERKEYFSTCHNQNFQVKNVPYELPAISPYPWIKFIRRTLFEGLHFPEGIRFEDLPVAYLLAVKAGSIGFLDQCFYNYRKNVGFLSRLTPSTLHIKNAIIFMKEEMQKLGLSEPYQEELDFIAIRHFFYRFWKLLTNYEPDKKELKLQLINELFDYMDQQIPDWEDNHYVRYSLPPHLARMQYLYGSRAEMLHFVESCDGMTAKQQKAWIKEYRTAHQKEGKNPSLPMLHQQQTAAQFYRFAYTGSLAPDPEQIFLESQGGQEVSSWELDLVVALARNFGDHHVIISLEEDQRELFLALLIRRISGTSLSLNDFIPTLSEEESKKNNEEDSDIELPKSFLSWLTPNCEEYGKALALSGYVLTDGPLPYYFQREEGQFFLLYCGRNLYPETFQNTPSVHVDTGLWQHTMFMADCLYFNNEQNRDIYQKECMTRGICPTPYVIGAPKSSDSHTPKEDSQPSVSDDILALHILRDKIRRSLQMDKYQTILCAPLLPGSCTSDAAQTFRNFMSALFILDQELTDQQIFYLHPGSGHETDVSFSEFVHIKEMPHGIDTTDFAQSCDIFISDYHSALETDFLFGTRKLRFVCGSFRQRVLPETGRPGHIQDTCFPDYPYFDNATELSHYLKDLLLISPPGHVSTEVPAVSIQETSRRKKTTLSEIVCSLLNGRPLPYQQPPHQSQVLAQDLTQTADESSHRPRVLFYTGRKLSQNLIHDFNTLAAQAPEKDFWLAYNDFCNPDSARYLAHLAPECSCLPLKPEPKKSRKWKLASVLTSRMGLSALYPITHLLALGKEECGKILGNATFDEVIITSTDSIKTVATLLAAAPVASYTFDTFNPERYSTSRPYRNQIAFLCRLLKNAGCLELPEELTGMKLAHSSGGNKDKKPL